MIRTDNDEDSMRQSLDEVVELFELAQNSVFKLMASVRNPFQGQKSLTNNCRTPSRNSCVIPDMLRFCESMSSM